MAKQAPGGGKACEVGQRLEMEVMIKCADISNVLFPNPSCCVEDVPDTRGKCPANTRDVLDTPRCVLGTPGRVLDAIGDVLDTLGDVPRQLEMEGMIKCADISNVRPTPCHDLLNLTSLRESQPSYE